jgi:hypothetical protein
MKLLKRVVYSISLNSIKHDFGKKRNIIIHHGLMGSAKNFKSLSKHIAFSKYANSHLIDARNHGKSKVKLRIITTHLDPYD